MFGFLTSRFQTPGASDKTRNPAWYDRHFAPVLLWVSKKACTHPIHTIVMIACVASYSYLGVLDQGLLERNTDKALGKVDFNTLLAGSQKLRIGEETAWKWEAEEARFGVNVEHVGIQLGSLAPVTNRYQPTQELALITLVFPESSTVDAAPSRNALPRNVSTKLVPSSSSSFSTISSDSSLAFSIPYAEAPDFLMAMQEISAPKEASEAHGSTEAGTREEKKWIMKAARSGNTPGGLRNWARESWTSFVDLLKVCRHLALEWFRKLTQDRTRIPATSSLWPWDILRCI
jgi:hydroxymethylglutaryl-CoA reductase (NADPH)